MIEGDIVKITDVQTWTTRGEQILNMYWFRMEGVEAEEPLDDMLGAMGLAFEAAIIDPIRAVQAVSVTHGLLQVKSYGTGGEEGDYIYSPAVAGSGGSVPDNPASALSFKLVRTSRDTRNGSKRIGGYADALINDGSGAGIATSTEITDIEEALGNSWSFTSELSTLIVMRPVIVRLTPGTDIVAQYNYVKAAVFRGLGTQTSRKRLL